MASAAPHNPTLISLSAFCNSQHTLPSCLARFSIRGAHTARKPSHLLAFAYVGSSALAAQLPGKLLFVSHCPESLFTLKFSLISLTPSEELIAPSSLVLQYLFAILHCIFKEYLFLSHCLLQHCDQQAPSLVYFPQIFAELNYIVLY